MAGTLLRAHRGAAAVLGLLTLTAALLLAALPRTFEKAYDGALGAELSAATASATDLEVGLHPRTPIDLLTSPAAFADRDASWRADLPPALRRVVTSGATSHYSAQTYRTPVTAQVGGRPKLMEYVDLAWLSDADRRVTYVAGRPPGPAGTLTVDGTRYVRYDVAIIQEAADMMGLPVGTTVLIGDHDPMAVTITGFLKINNPADRYWDHHLDVIKMGVEDHGDDEFYLITGLTSADSLKYLNQHRELHYSWVLGVDRTALDSRNARGVADSVGVYERKVSSRTQGISPYGLHTSLEGLLTDFLKRLGTAQTLLVLILGGLALVAVSVLALAAQLLTERMRASLSLMRARGASLPRVAGTGTAVAALVTVPAAAAGLGLAYLVPGPATPVAVLAPPLLALAVIGFAFVRLTLTHRSPLHDRRDDLVARRPSPRRMMIEVTIIGLALAGAYLLRTRGLTGSESGPDPFLMAIPAALTLAAALITLRCYPYPLRLVVRLAGRRREAVPFLGFTQAARARATTSLPVLILLPALAVSVFSSVVSLAIGDTQLEAAWRHVGAQARIQSAGELPAETIERIRRLPGVEAVVPVAEGRAQVDFTGLQATVLAVDLAAYRKLVAGSPLTVPDPPAETAGGIPALISPSLGVSASVNIGWQTRMTVIKKGEIASLPGLAPAEVPLIVLPYDAPERAGLRTFATTLLIKGDVEDATLAKAVNAPDTLVMTVGGEFERIKDAPLTAAILTALTIVTVALTGYALVSVVISLVIGAADRARALAYLRTLGLSQRQARGLTVLEVAPLIVLTSLAGLLLGFALPAAIAPGIDLSAYAGLPVDGFPIAWGTPSLLAAGLTAVAVLAAFAHASTGRAVTGALRLGESA